MMRSLGDERSPGSFPSHALFDDRGRFLSDAGSSSLMNHLKKIIGARLAEMSMEWNIS